MSAYEDGNHLTNERISVDDATSRAAALHVCSRAIDTDDAENLLQALGLAPYIYDGRLAK